MNNSTTAKRPPPVQQPMHATEEISRYKKLLDDGAITKEEYDFIKRKILGL